MHDSSRHEWTSRIPAGSRVECARLKRVLLRAARLLAFAAAAGCRDEAANRTVPSRGVNTETVEYHAPNPGARVVAVPDVALKEQASPAAAIGPLPALRQKFPTAFEGSFTADDAASNVIFVRFFTVDAAGRRTITNEAAGHAVLVENDGKFRYRIELDAPQTLGVNHIEISLMRAATGTGAESELPDPRTDVLAVGEVEIE